MMNVPVPHLRIAELTLVDGGRAVKIRSEAVHRIESSPTAGTLVHIINPLSVLHVEENMEEVLHETGWYEQKIEAVRPDGGNPIL